MASTRDASRLGWRGVRLRREREDALSGQRKRPLPAGIPASRPVSDSPPAAWSFPISHHHFPWPSSSICKARARRRPEGLEDAPAGGTDGALPREGSALGSRALWGPRAPSPLPTLGLPGMQPLSSATSSPGVLKDASTAEGDPPPLHGIKSSPAIHKG